MLVLSIFMCILYSLNVEEWGLCAPGSGDLWSRSGGSGVWVFVCRAAQGGVGPSLEPLRGSGVPLFRGDERGITRFRVVLRLAPWGSGISLFWSGFGEGFALFLGGLVGGGPHFALSGVVLLISALLGSKIFTLLH